jgi:hypothetical protein
MAVNQPRPTLADYLVIAISPALIMVLVASLVLFLLEIFYAGQYETRLRWIMFCFVFAAVLIARISMTPGIAERASLYGLVLAAAVFIALQMLVQYPSGLRVAGFTWAINLGIMAVIWWCAHKLTWDCTFIDEHVDVSGAGLLEAAGLDSQGANNEGARGEGRGARDGDVSSLAPRPTPHAPSLSPSPGLFAWWERYHRYRQEQQQRPHAPGVWIVYFSLAALPLFGLGQSLIGANELGRRQRVFWYMVFYVGSALGLLLNTSFLGLRRYLRQRRLIMPVAVAGVWVGIGAVLIAVLLVAGAFLPRPYPEYPLIPVQGWLGSPERDASKYAVMNDSPGKGEGRPGAAGKDGREGSASGSQGQGGGQQGQNGSGSSAQGQSGSGQGKGEQGSGGGSSGKSGSGQNGNSSGSGGNRQGQSSQGNSGNQSGQQGSPARSGNGERSQAGDPNSSQGGSNQGKGSQADQGQSGQGMKRLSEAEAANQSPASSPPGSSLSSLLNALGRLLRWIIFAIAALVVAFIVLRAILKFLANFTGWARGLLDALQGLWEALFAWLGPAAAPSESEEPALLERRQVPFAAFRDPFMDGSSARQSPEELVRYSFHALEAWAREQDLGRQADDTPLEFADRVALNVPDTLAADCRRVATLYARAAYARGPLPASCEALLRQFWRHLTEAGRVSVPGSR